MGKHKAGFVNIIGNPNVGKSTLMNALVGEKLSIVTAKAQTTRHRIIGIVNGEDYQIVYSDTPGILKPSYRLQESMMNFVDTAIGDADIILYVTDTVEKADKNTTGVLMFTNDGEIAERLTHPSYDKKKIYQVSLDRDLSQEDYDKIVAGVELSDGEVAADALDYIEDNDKRKIGIEIHSGKNRIVRRIFESLGYDVKALDRVYFAGLTKKGLKRGEWRYLTEGEVNILKMGAYI